MIPQDTSLDTTACRRRDPIDSDDSSTNVPSSPPAADSFRFNCSTAGTSSSSSFSVIVRADTRGRGSDSWLRRRRHVVHGAGRVRRLGVRRQPTPRNSSVKDLKSTEEPMTTTMELTSTICAKAYIQTKPASNDSLSSCDEDQLPLDPRQWSREDVQSWLRQMSVDYDHVIATPDYDITDRFPMNGRGLCLMARKPEMFETRVPCGGLLLFHDFRSRLLRAITSSIDSRRTIAAPTVA